MSVRWVMRSGGLRGYVQGFSKDRVSGEQLKMHPGATSMHCGI